MTHSETILDHYDLTLHPMVRQALSEMIEAVLIRGEDSAEVLKKSMNKLQGMQK